MDMAEKDGWRQWQAELDYGVGSQGVRKETEKDSDRVGRDVEKEVAGS